MRKIAALAGAAAIAVSGVGVAQARLTVDDAHPHKHHEKHHRHHGVQHARHGADDGPNHT
jgi:Spy/CpxP family protein refolding chaperone